MDGWMMSRGGDRAFSASRVSKGRARVWGRGFCRWSWLELGVFFFWIKRKKENKEMDRDDFSLLLLLFFCPASLRSGSWAAQARPV